MSIKKGLCYLLLALQLLAANGETFHFEMDEGTFSCDSGTELELKLKTFNLNCVDGIGCDYGEGILGAVAYTAVETFPSFIHVLVHGCHYFDQYCPEDEFDGFVEICDRVAGHLIDEDSYCSGASEESRFTLGLPFPHLRSPGSPAKVEEVTVSMTVDDLHYCEAEFTVTLEEGPATSLLAVGAPLVGVGVSFFLGVSAIVHLVSKRRREINADQWDDKMVHRFEMMPPAQY